MRTWFKIMETNERGSHIGEIHVHDSIIFPVKFLLLFASSHIIILKLLSIYFICVDIQSAENSFAKRFFPFPSILTPFVDYVAADE